MAHPFETLDLSQRFSYECVEKRQEICMYVCMYVSIYLSIYLSMYLCIYVSMYVSMCVCVRLCIDIHIITQFTYIYNRNYI